MLWCSQDFQARLNNDLVELSQLRQARNRKSGHPLPPLPGEGRPKSTILQESSMTQNVRLRNGVNGKPETADRTGSVSASCSSTPLPGRKARPVSTGGRVESSIPETIAELKEPDRDENRSQLRLLMYIVGGREVGQVEDQLNFFSSSFKSKLDCFSMTGLFSLPSMNTLTYLSDPYITTIKGLITVDPGLNVIKLFTAAIYKFS